MHTSMYASLVDGGIQQHIVAKRKLGIPIQTNIGSDDCSLCF